MNAFKPREEASCWVSVEQSPFVLGLIGENGELLLDEQVQVTRGSKIKDRHLFLFSGVLVFAKVKSNTGYRLEHRVSLEDLWLCGYEDEPVAEEGAMEDVDLGMTLILAWGLHFCLACFRSPEVKERWLDALHRQIQEAKASVGSASPPPDVLMKVLSGNGVTTKSLSGGRMEQVIELPLDGDHLNNREDRPSQSAETKWDMVRRRMRKAPSFISKAKRSESDAAQTQLFGQPLCKICPDDGSLPKPVADMLMQLRKKGPSTEGVFRKTCNNKNMRDVREQLNSGLEVDLEAQPVLLLVGLLKSFLKELPGSLLVSNLYDSWVSALDNEDPRQREQEVRKVLDELPGANWVLLQHLLCVLHHILQSADTNKMDAYNLAVCIGPTLLQLDGVPLDEQKDRIEKVTALTQFLIENSDVLGENIPNLLDTDEDSMSSLHHDSAYDSTDPDGDGEAGEGAKRGSSSSLEPYALSRSGAPWPADAKPEFNRRCSEPIILLSPHLAAGLCGHSRSHDDCSQAFGEQPLKKQISDDSFLLRRQDAVSRAESGPQLYSAGGPANDCSCSSLESAASNQSEGSVFTGSPAGSPASTRRAGAAPPPPPEIPAPVVAGESRRSHSIRVAAKVLMRTRSLGGFATRGSIKKEAQKETSFPCGTLREDSQSEAEAPAEPCRRQRPLSAVEAFRLADSRMPCRPPAYEQAVRSAGLLPPRYGSLTVHAVMELGRRSRPSSVNYDFPSAAGAGPHGEDDDEGGAEEQRRRPFRQRAMSESVTAGGRRAAPPRRCSHPVFEDLSYAKESYV
ncbi:T cell activation RhoGTPase activating protein b [Nelusetta ayraudi]|uniref:T cell activation RhoGTPase activating protein b n=1 Tax=Nelusetta ayraudi TaxID=303726 RepID=UPI003F708A80